MFFDKLFFLLFSVFQNREHLKTNQHPRAASFLNQQDSLDLLLPKEAIKCDQIQELIIPPPLHFCRFHFPRHHHDYALYSQLLCDESQIETRRSNATKLNE